MSTMDTAFGPMLHFHKRNGSFVCGRRWLERVPDEVPQLRARLILEEFAETVCAIQEKYLIGVADGLTDLTYVLVGTLVSFSHDDTHLRDVPWPIRFLGPGDGQFIFQKDESLESIQLLTSAVSNVIAALHHEPSERLLFMVEYALRIVSDVAADYYLPLRALFDEVHRSNLTKELGGAGDGAKYGNKGAKGETYSPPDIARVLRSVGHEV